MKICIRISKVDIHVKRTKSWEGRRQAFSFMTRCANPDPRFKYPISTAKRRIALPWLAIYVYPVHQDHQLAEEAAVCAKFKEGTDPVAVVYFPRSSESYSVFIV